MNYIPVFSEYKTLVPVLMNIEMFLSEQVLDFGDNFKCNLVSSRFQNDFFLSLPPSF